MHRPLSTNPLVALLARKAFAHALPRLGPGAGVDPWCGLGLIASQAVGEGRDRTPGTWVKGWPEAARKGLAKARVSSAWQQAKQPRVLPSIAELVVVANEGRKRSTAWGDWESMGPALFGVTPAESLHEETFFPASMKVIGIVAEPVGKEFSKETLWSLEKAKAAGKEVWAEVPDTLESWGSWSENHWLLLHRLGVAVWFRPPNQEGWAAYAAFLDQQVAGWVKSPHTEQWAWPMADLLGQAMEDLIVYGKPTHKEAAPWAWEGRCKNPDWLKLRKQLWATSQSALGGSGALEEILVGAILADAGLLVSFSLGEGLA